MRMFFRNKKGCVEMSFSPPSTRQWLGLCVYFLFVWQLSLVKALISLTKDLSRRENKQGNYSKIPSKSPHPPLFQIKIPDFDPKDREKRIT